MKKFMKIGAFLSALLLFSVAATAEEKPYQDTVEAVVLTNLGDLSMLYTKYPPQGKDLIVEILEAAAWSSGTTLSELHEGAVYMYNLSGVNLVVESEEELTDEDLDVIDEYNELVFTETPDFDGLEYESVEIDEAYEIGINYYENGQPSEELTYIVVYKVDGDWYWVPTVENMEKTLEQYM